MRATIYKTKTVIRDDGFRLITEPDGSGTPRFNVARANGRKLLEAYYKLGAKPEMVKIVNE